MVDALTFTNAKQCYMRFDLERWIVRAAFFSTFFAKLEVRQTQEIFPKLEQNFALNSSFRKTLTMMRPKISLTLLLSQKCFELTSNEA